MTRENLAVSRDRMRYTKDKLSANLVLAAIVLDALYFVSIYQSDVSTWYYNWVIGASIILNLLFLLTAFLASEGVKSRKSGFTSRCWCWASCRLYGFSIFPPGPTPPRWFSPEQKFR